MRQTTKEKVKATIIWYDGIGLHDKHEKIVQSQTAFPKDIVKAFIKQTGLPKSTYIKTIKLDDREYRWCGNAGNAYMNER